MLQQQPSEGIAVSVIIPVLNDAPRLRTCLDALESQTFDLPFEVLVVNNGSSDDPASVLRAFPAARLLHEQQRSSYAARNTGVRQARGEVLAFTDSDCIPAEDWLERVSPRLYDEGIRQLERFLADLERRYPGSTR